MNVTDVAIVLLTMTALVLGIELGLVRQVFSASGLLVGLFLGAWLQGFIVNSVQTPSSKAFLTVMVIASCTILGMSIGEVVGHILKQKVHESRVRVLEKADRASGAIVGATVLLLIVWLCASIFARTPIVMLQQQLKGSVIISQLNHTLPEAPNVVARLGHLIAPNGFPDVFEGLEPRVNTDKPLPSIGQLDPAVQKARASVVKISGKGCGGVSTGSGFIAAPDLVVTNAHVVAGVAKPTIIDANGQHVATVAWFDPKMDVAILRSPALTAAPLAMAGAIAANGTAAAVLGYPGGGDFSAEPASVLDSFVATGRDIYNQETIRRQVYSLKANVVQGNSGGPVINQDGTVIGLIFAKSATYGQVGYALTMQQVIDALEQASTATGQANTGGCT